MIRRLAFVLVLCLLLPAMAGAVTFEDDLGRTVSVEQPKRVAVLIGSFADVWSLAGGSETIVGAAHDAFTDFDIPLPADTADLGSSKSVSLEALLATEPDFVIGSCNTQSNLDLLDPLEEMGIPAAFFSVSTFEDYLRMLKICTGITGQEENYTLYGENVRQQVEQAIARQDGSAPSVLYLRVSSTGVKVKGSRDNVLGEMLSALGCRNIADDDDSLLETLSLEVILAEDPDYIFVVLQGDDTEALTRVLEEELTGNTGFSTLSAVKAGRYSIMDNRLYNLKPNSRWGEAYEKLADILYPRP